MLEGQGILRKAPEWAEHEEQVGDGRRLRGGSECQIERNAAFRWALVGFASRPFGSACQGRRWCILKGEKRDCVAGELGRGERMSQAE